MHTNFSILLLDEVLDAGLDASGVDATVKVLKTMGREEGTSIFLISHREEVSARVSKTIVVRKENGFSSIEETDE
jgi:ABC-type branched-subunit amino acid transport system ATPase component